MSFLQDIFRVRVVYKNGYTHDFECFTFRIVGGAYEWDSLSNCNTPIKLGADDVAAVWQVGFRRRINLAALLWWRRK